MLLRLKAMGSELKISVSKSKRKGQSLKLFFKTHRTYTLILV